MAEEIKREIWLLQRRRIPPIDIAEGSQIPIALTLMDYSIPAGATAKAYARPWDRETTYQQTATVDGNTVRFTPPDGFFRAGGNALQIEINGNKIPLLLDVNCGPRLSNGGDGATPEAVRPLVERAESAAKAAATSAAGAEASAQGIRDSAERINENSTGISQLKEDLIPINTNTIIDYDIEYGIEINDIGETQKNDQWWTSCFIDLLGVEKISIPYRSEAPGKNYYYDENKEFVSKTDYTNETDFAIPKGVRFLRINGVYENRDKLKIYFRYVNTLKDLVDDNYSINLFTPILNIGYLAESNGVFASQSKSTVTTMNYIFAKRGSTISCKDGFKFRLALYSSDNSDSFIENYPKGAYAFTNEPYTFKCDVFFRASISKNDESEILKTDIADNFIFNIKNEKHKIEEKLNSVENKIANISKTIKKPFPVDYYNSVIPTSERTLFDSDEKRANIETVYSYLDNYLSNGFTKTKIFTANNIDGYAYFYRPKSVEINANKNDNATYENNYPTIMIMCNQHGGHERSTVFGITYFIKALFEHRHESQNLEYIYNGVNLIIIPSSNPYGYNNITPLNENGVDLDRNWDWRWTKTEEGRYYSGSTAASEVETQAIQYLVRQYKPTLFIDWHTVAGNPTAHELNWIDPCNMENEIENIVANNHLQLITDYMPKKYNIEMSGVDFIGYILAGGQSGSPKDYAKSNGASYATLFEGINKFPNETSDYSSNVQEYNEELIINFISEFLRVYIN